MSSAPQIHVIDTEHSFSWGNFYLVGTADAMSAALASRQSFSIKCLQDELSYIQYLRAHSTLAKWFFGKKSALTKINQDRVQRYLKEDTKSFKNVLQFFGSDGSFIKS